MLWQGCPYGANCCQGQVVVLLHSAGRSGGNWLLVLGFLPTCEGSGRLPDSAGRPFVQFISRPFVVGERIEVMAPGSGSKWLVGVVERVDPMRTIIRSDACLPITIPNKVTRSVL